MMSYSTIDKVITEWAEENRLHLYKNYKDIEVRSVEGVNSKGIKYQIWVEKPKKTKVIVSVWDFKKQRKDWKINIQNLSSTLQEAFKEVSEWNQKN